jgi:hypothetical protein
MTIAIAMYLGALVVLFILERVTGKEGSEETK